MLLGGAVAPCFPVGAWCSLLGGVGSPGRSFFAYHEVDGSAEVFFGAGDVSPVSYGDRLLSDYVFDVCGED